MADLNFQELQAQLPVGAIVADTPNNDILISIKNLIGESTVSLLDPKLSEALSKLLDGCSKAQVVYNADVTKPNDLRSYNSPTVGVPVPDSTGQYAATFTYVFSVKIPLNKDSTVAVEAQV
jgi:hypothetical protein